MSCQRFKADSLLFLPFVGSLWHLAFPTFCGNQRKAFSVLIIFRFHCLISLDAAFMKIAVVSGLAFTCWFRCLPSLDDDENRKARGQWQKVFTGASAAPGEGFCVKVHNFAKNSSAKSAYLVCGLHISGIHMHSSQLLNLKPTTSTFMFHSSDSSASE